MLSKYEAENRLADFCAKGLTGGVAALICGDRVEFASAGLAARVPERRPLSADAVYDLASLTKVTGTVTAVLLCIERGLLTLEAPVARWLPWYPWDTTVLQLLTHTSGLPADDKAYRHATDQSAQQQFVAALTLEYQPGSRVVYSDFGFIVLGWLIEAVAGDLDALLRQTVFAPLGMSDTGYHPARHGLADRCVPTEEVAGRGVVQGTVHDSKAHAMGGVSGHAGLFSTAADLAKFAQMLLAKGAPVFKHETVALLRRCYTQHLNEGRSLGWLTVDGAVLYHTGFTGTSMSIDFEKNEAVVLLTNAVHPKRGAVDLPALRQAFHSDYFSAVSKRSSEKENER